MTRPNSIHPAIADASAASAFVQKTREDMHLLHSVPAKAEKLRGATHHFEGKSGTWPLYPAPAALHEEGGNSSTKRRTKVRRVSSSFTAAQEMLRTQLPLGGHGTETNVGCFFLPRLRVFVSSLLRDPATHTDTDRVPEASEGGRVSWRKITYTSIVWSGGKTDLGHRKYVVADGEPERLLKERCTTPPGAFFPKNRFRQTQAAKQEPSSADEIEQEDNPSEWPSNALLRLGGTKCPKGNPSPSSFPQPSVMSCAGAGWQRRKPLYSW